MVKGSGLTYFMNRGCVFERVGVFKHRWVVERGWAIVGDVVREGGVVVGDVARERVGMVVAVSSLSLSLVSWYMGGVIVGDVAHERVAVVASPSLSLVTWYAGGWHHRW